MKKYGIASLSPLNSWVRKYREGGPEALRPKPKGRPPGSASSAKPKTVEQESPRRTAGSGRRSPT